ncbi:MAG TPA: HEAT repeat domain-containing protein [Steroidobacteraceae bacterium]|jgi:HEAT repeat protein
MTGAADYSADADAGIAGLQRRLTSEDPAVRRVAVLELADSSEESLLHAILSILRHDPDPALRAEAARALAGWDGDEVVEALAAALRDELPVRGAAASSLTELKDASAAARLIPYAADPDAFVCASALRGLKELRLTAAAAPAMVALSHAEATVRREAVGVLGWLKQAAALPLLARTAVEDADAEVRRAAAGALGLAAPANDAALVALRAALRDAVWTVREEAATTLGKFRDSGGAIVAALRAAMADDYWQVRLRAARSLGRLRDAQALPLLIEALLHPAGNLRKEAAIALGEIGEATAVCALEAAGADPDPEVRKAVRLALQRLTSG